MELSSALEAIAAVVATIGTIVTIYLSLRQRERRASSRQLYKVVYIKMYHLRLREEGVPPVYRKLISRLNREIDVYDEFHYYRLNIFRRPQKDFSIRDRSSGTVDMQIVHPMQELLFSDKGAGAVGEYLEQTIRKQSDVFLTNTTYFNGFQKGNEDFGMKMELDTDEARMVVDFSSISNHQAIVTVLPRGVYRRGDREEEITVTKPLPGIFQMSRKELEKDDVLRMDFTIAWENVK